MRFYIPLLLCVVCLIAVIPAFLYGFELADKMHANWVAPIPAVLCCLGVGLFGLLVDKHADA